MTGPYAAQMSIEAMLRESGADEAFDVWRDGSRLVVTVEGYNVTAELERFAALVRAAALEEAARVCEEVSARGNMLGGEDAHALVCADAIRALAATKPNSP